jgi:CheY-like chemotaxis protein
MSSVNGRVLIVDDDPLARDLVCKLLRRGGYVAVPAADGAEALAALRGESARPAVVLLDLNMPVLDGWEVLEACCHDPALAEVPVVVLSGRDDAEATLSLGADAVLRKPINPETLIREVDRLVGVAAGD